MTGGVPPNRPTAQRTLASEPRILDRFTEEVRAAGLVGEARAAKLVYLVLVSRFLPRPVSAVVKAPSAAGKSYLVETVLRFFPPDAFYTVTGMSERALVYSEEPLAHRIIVIYEAAGLSDDGFAPTSCGRCSARGICVTRPSRRRRRASRGALSSSGRVRPARS
jgi:hypothetical protein